jgi:hypothetical protein
MYCIWLLDRETAFHLSSTTFIIHKIINLWTDKNSPPSILANFQCFSSLNDLLYPFVLFAFKERLSHELDFKEIDKNGQMDISVAK